MTDPYEAERKELRNWGRWARLNPDAPDSSCANPLYDQYVPDSDDDGWGVPTKEMVDAAKERVSLLQFVQGADEIRELDAENMDGWIRQLWGAHRQVLVRHYVLRNKQERECVDAAIRAIWDLQLANRESVREVQRRLTNKP